MCWTRSTSLPNKPQIPTPFSSLSSRRWRTSTTYAAIPLFLFNSPTLTQVGHSLGGALAELDALFMVMNLPSSIHVKGVTYGTPRVGNPAYATFFDSKVSLIEVFDFL